MDRIKIVAAAGGMLGSRECKNEGRVVLGLMKDNKIREPTGKLRRWCLPLNTD
jgi:hypothetical protein